MTDIEVHQIDAGPGLTSYASGQGEPIVLVMGLACCAADWGPLRTLLAERARVISFDNRGTGRSAGVTGEFDLEHLAEDTFAVMDAHGLTTANIVGYSMGGMIAQIMAAKHPDRVKRLALLSTHAGAQTAAPPHPSALEVLFQRRETIEQLIRSQLEVFSAPRFCGCEQFEAMLRVRLENITPLQTVALQMSAIQGSERAQQVAALRTPTLIVHGREDTLIPFANGERLRELIPHAEFEALDGTGHMLPWEAPQEVSARLARFFDL